MKYLLLIAVLFGNCSTSSNNNSSPPVNTPGQVDELRPPGEPQCKNIGGLPDPICSPGVARTQDLSTICGPTGTYRPTKYQELRFKKDVMKEYGFTNFHTVILDHVIPVEIGGDGFDERNMTIQTLATAHKKDLVENAAKRAICHSKMDAAMIQQAMASNWIALGKQLRGQ